jgi:hypothetical protein
MAENAQLRAELYEAKTEVQRLRDSIALTNRPVHKDLSLVALVPKFSGNDTITLEEFLSTVDRVSRIGKWKETDRVEVALLKLAGIAKSFYFGCTELHKDGLSWKKLQSELSKRFQDRHTDQFHFIRLQSAKQSRDENVLQFADRCRSLAQKTVRKNDDQVEQRILQENADLLRGRSNRRNGKARADFKSAGSESSKRYGRCDTRSISSEVKRKLLHKNG